MPRSDLLMTLLEASFGQDHVLMRRALEALIAEERHKQHNIFANQLEQVLKNGEVREKQLQGQTISDERVRNLLFELTPKRTLEDLMLPEEVSTPIKELVEEHRRQDLLRSFNLEPRNSILLAGPPGNGKTSLAEAMANALMIPFMVVRYESVIGSYLGETAVRLRKVFDYVRTRNCVLFFDEFDTLGKERGDIHETGEIKRVVSSLLLQMDDLPKHVIVVTATNHPELLDRAVWRRFQLRLLLPPPRQDQLIQWFESFEQKYDCRLEVSSKTLAEKLHGLSFAEVEEFTNDILRRRVLQLPEADMRKIISQRLNQLQHRFVPKK
jgi:SpoVK/Ycf46/Vps4 family AAA+-type ATPase